jgi:Domain of unknown function (DUF4160)
LQPLSGENWRNRRYNQAKEAPEPPQLSTDKVGNVGNAAMPEISRFFGIIIRMYWNDHEPPHFHAIYGEYEALIEIETLAIYRGELPRRALALVLEWAEIHRGELRSNWLKARALEPIQPVVPLE